MIKIKELYKLMFNFFIKQKKTKTFDLLKIKTNIFETILLEKILLYNDYDTRKNICIVFNKFNIPINLKIINDKELYQCYFSNKINIIQQLIKENKNLEKYDVILINLLQYKNINYYYLINTYNFFIKKLFYINLLKNKLNKNIKKINNDLNEINLIEDELKKEKFNDIKNVIKYLNRINDDKKLIIHNQHFIRIINLINHNIDILILKIKEIKSKKKEIRLIYFNDFNYYLLNKYKKSIIILLSLITKLTDESLFEIYKDSMVGIFLYDDIIIDLIKFVYKNRKYYKELLKLCIMFYFVNSRKITNIGLENDLLKDKLNLIKINVENSNNDNRTKYYFYSNYFEIYIKNILYKLVL